MPTMNQKEAVVKFIKEILGSNFDATRSASEQLTKEQRTQVNTKVYNGIVNGEIAYNKDITDTTTVKRYVSGMVSNHIRKAKELNGGTPYAPATKGRGTRDSELSALNTLLSKYDEGTTEYNDVMTHINQRKVEISSERSAKRTAKTLDVSFLPQDLQDLASES